jgi:hypothetical protein
MNGCSDLANSSSSRFNPSSLASNPLRVENISKLLVSEEAADRVERCMPWPHKLEATVPQLKASKTAQARHPKIAEPNLIFA